jgi:hypothetical protein
MSDMKINESEVFVMAVVGRKTRDIAKILDHKIGKLSLIYI